MLHNRKKEDSCLTGNSLNSFSSEQDMTHTSVNVDVPEGKKEVDELFDDYLKTDEAERLATKRPNHYDQDQ